MSKKYTLQEIIEMLKDKKEKLYTKSCLNYKGVSKENIPYVELISENISFDDIEPYYRDLKENFRYPIRKKSYPKTESEKGLCRYWYNTGSFDELTANSLGSPLQYEINLVKSSKVNIDLISYVKNNEKRDVLYLIEVKGRGPTKTNKNNWGKNYYFSPESLLRCILEIRTYYKTLMKNQAIFKNDMGFKNAELKLAVLIPEDSLANQQYSNLQEYKNLKMLLDGDGTTENPKIEVIVYEGKIQKKYK